MHEHHSRLSLSEQVAHAIRVHSAKGAAVALAAAAARQIVPVWWNQKAPWYAGRVAERFRSPARLDGSRFNVPDGPTATSFKGLLWVERYETLERHAIAKWLSKTLPLVELGASIGVVSCLANRRLLDSTRHVAVEANPAIIPVLRSNRDQNRCRFQIVHAALAYGAESVDFGISDNVVANSVASAHSSAHVRVPTVSLGSLTANAGFDACSLVCDIEGAERDLMAHEADVLRRVVESVIMEVHPGILGEDGVADLYDRFRGLGFSPVWQRGSIWVLSKTKPH